jgi:protein phosphatase
MNITIPELSLVMLIGASGSGKSSFARTHFVPTEILSSDFFRGLVSDNENDQAATKDAFEALHFVLRKRLARGQLTVIDATNIRPEDRKIFVGIAREFHVLPVAVVLDLPESICLERNRSRPDRDFGPHVVRSHVQALRRSGRNLEREGFRHVFTLRSPEEVETALVSRQRLWNNLKHLRGPFDIVGDVHGCLEELHGLLQALGYAVLADGTVFPPEGRTLVFVGDLVDRGPDTPGVLKLVMGMVEAGTALCVPGNHDDKLKRKLEGREVNVTHGLAESLEQLSRETPEFRAAVLKFIDGLVSHLVLDDGKLVVAHAGMKAEFQGRGSRVVREFALYGETTGETDEFGLPVRHNWAAEYRGQAMVVYGHTPVLEPEWVNRTLDVDTGCVFGGKLTALRYPEKELVSVQAKREYAAPKRPFNPRDTALSQQHELDDVLDLEDVTGKRVIETRLHGRVTVREENAIAALEVMSRFAVNPKWLIYLPPTMSPSETTLESGLLEHPNEAFAYYRKQGVTQVMLEEKHMGSRAVMVVCRDQASASKRFGVLEESGVVYTRTGRRFFADANLELALLDRVRQALTASNFWDEFQTDWAILDGELMPWSAKAQELLERQYAPVGASARASLAAAVDSLERTSAANPDVAALLERFQMRSGMAADYSAAYARYCWPVSGIEDYKFAPFHLLASEGTVHTNRDHTWHMRTLERICAQDPSVLLVTANRLVDLTDEISQLEGVQWWETMTAKGGEGMVVKPLEFIVKGKRGLVQPAIKVRGREYLRIIYGPEYTAPEHLERLRFRGLSTKRSMALREFALGLEALERFVGREPLRCTHEAVFAVLALESEPVDPRL